MKNAYRSDEYDTDNWISKNPYHLFLTKIRNQLACLDQFQIRKRIAPNKVNKYTLYLGTAFKHNENIDVELITKKMLDKFIS
tara:strand:- start:182 stop:427 length:246 start_codon:yes stop_codon:yes gene_type:complete